MFLYPALLTGFFFVAVPLLVHLINMLRHRRQRWAAMDFLLASYRKQKKWIRLRQLLLLLSRLAAAALLVAMLCGWTGGGKILGALGGQTTHHVVVLDDSYSMGDASGGDTAYARALQSLQGLTRRLASDDGNHQLTVMRASRAAMAVRGGSESGDAAADLAAQTITTDARLINRLMATQASSVRTDLIPALDLASELISSIPADTKYLYVASDFRQRDWGSPERLANSLQSMPTDEVEIRMIDCATAPAANLGITSLSPTQDVWVAGVPVVVSVTVHNYGQAPAKNISISNRVIRYPKTLDAADPTLQFSGQLESLPALLIETIDPGAEVTKTFQVFITEQGTHAIEVALPDDALPIDNVRACTLPLSDVEKVLVIDGDADIRGGYHVSSVLDPGSQVRIGAVPDIQPPSFLRSATMETLAPYRAIYLIDLPEISENAAGALDRYVRRGGGLAWFIGDEAQKESYNRVLLARDRFLLPAPLGEAVRLPVSSDRDSGDVLLGDDGTFLDPLRSGGDGAWSLLGLAQSWTLEKPSLDDEATASESPRVRTVLKRRDDKPLVTQHELGEGRIVTVLTGLNGRWTNWPSDPTFVPFLLLTNATLWSGAAPPTQRAIDDALVRRLPPDLYTPDVMYLPATNEPPRIPIEVVAQPPAKTTDADESISGEPIPMVNFQPQEMVISGESNIDEILRPGISEWVLTQSDGRGEVIPTASVIRVGEGDLRRANKAEVQQSLMPLEVQFVSSTAWSNQNRAAGSSTLTLVLFSLLALVLAAEQALAYWASYHVSVPGAGRLDPLGGKS
ncbi:BatA domain-containing protein [Stieleria marina]|uniref:Aerotolerance regulator N-terminal domain-containing protein n=1 Tax=Stieleria marina TaxID=1930275 RepID=A0A517P0U8_9BACT|nr:hypothetical protein K239x_50060 [Planctomycetes bacterium K23_9]